MKRVIKFLTFTIMLVLLKIDIAFAAEDNGTSVIIPMNDIPALQLGVSQEYKGNPYNNYKKLNIPAQITQQGNYYFIVDTYNNQVIYSTDMWKPLNEWKVMDRKLNMPHSIASDGEMYLVTDTDNNRVMCYEYINGRFQNTQRFDNIGIRPHYIQYDPLSEAFFVWSSETGDMYIIKKVPEYKFMYIHEIRHIYELKGFYVRSFCIDGDEIIFPSGNNSYMIRVDKETLQIKDRYPVTADICGMAYAKKIGNCYYLTVSTDSKLRHSAAKIIRTPDLKTLADGLYEDVTRYFNGMKIPYYIDQINGTYYITSHDSKYDIYKFNIFEDQILDVSAIR